MRDFQGFDVYFKLKLDESGSKGSKKMILCNQNALRTCFS
jgi:hypothetical protein